MDLILAPAHGAVKAYDRDIAEPLADAYSGGRDWDRHKAASQSKALQDALRQALGYRYASEVERCSTVLALQRDRGTGDLRVRPYQTCKRRWCPVCAWRKSLRQWACVVERLPGLIEQHGPVRWLLLTLTIRNCLVDDLPEACDVLLRGFRALTTPRTRIGRQWPATAWIRSVEVTWPRPGEAHPHVHVLMAVRPSYWSHGYITHAEWVSRWRQACRLSYDPVVDIRRVRPLSSALSQAIGQPLAEALGGLREVAKYLTKPMDISHRPDAARGLMLIKGRRLVDAGGWLRGVLRAPDPDADAEIAEVDLERIAVYWWRAAEERYRRRVDAWVPCRVRR